MTVADEIYIPLESYKMPHGKMLRVLAGRHLRWPAIVGGVIVVALSVMAFTIRWEFGFVALLLVFIVYPMLLMWLYVRQCLTLDVAMNTVEHTLTISPTKVMVRWRPSLMSGEREASDENVSPEDSRVAVELPWRDDEVPMSRVTDVSCGLNAVTVWLRDSGRGAGFLYIPYNTIPEGKADRVVEWFRNRNKEI